MFQRYLLAVVLVLAVAGCGDDAGSSAATTEPTAVTTTAPEGTTTTPEATTVAPTTTAVSTTSAPTSTTTTLVTSPTLVPATPTLTDGRPATFLAITDDYRAVEVDTTTGEIVHDFGQTGTPEQVAVAEEIAPNVLDGVWRILDGSMVGLSDCCEPAAGRIFYVPADGSLGDDPYAAPWEAGWFLSPSPTANMMANVGYSLVVHDPNVADYTGPGHWIAEPPLGFPATGAAWARDGSELYWITIEDEATMLATLDLAEGSPQVVAELPWVGANQSLVGIGSQANGNLVGFLDTRDSSFAITETSGVVFSTDGGLLASFSVETDSAWGGYDSSGKYLIYTDATGVVRWQGLGLSGTLGSGFLFASW